MGKLHYAISSICWICARKRHIEGIFQTPFDGKISFRFSGTASLAKIRAGRDLSACGTLCFAGMAAQNIWKQRSAHLIGGKDYDKFFELAVGLSEGHRDALRVAGYQRANQPLIAHKAKIEAIVEHLAEASEFASLML